MLTHSTKFKSELNSVMSGTIFVSTSHSRVGFTKDRHEEKVHLTQNRPAEMSSFWQLEKTAKEKLITYSLSLKCFLMASILSSNGWFPIPGASNTCMASKRSSLSKRNQLAGSLLVHRVRLHQTALKVTTKGTLRNFLSQTYIVLDILPPGAVRRLDDRDGRLELTATSEQLSVQLELCRVVLKRGPFPSNGDPNRLRR